MTPVEKIWHILEIIEDAQKLAPQGKLCQYDARKIDAVVARDDHEQIFEKLEKDEQAIEIHTRPDYINNFHYRWYVLPKYQAVYEKYKKLNDERATKVALKEYDRRFKQYRQSSPNIFDMGYDRHLNRVDQQQIESQRLAIEASDRRLQRDLEEKRHREDMQLQRMLATKEDKRAHAINLILERIEHIKSGPMGTVIAFLDFNFGHTNDNYIHVFRPFMEELQSSGCFTSFQRGHAGPGQANVSFQDIHPEMLKKYRDDLLAKISDAPRSVQTIKNEAVIQALRRPASNTEPDTTKRRVFFDKENGNLFLDNKRIYTASLTGPEYHFLCYLWDNWQKQLRYDDIHKYVREKMGKDVADIAKNFCAKMKNNIKKKCTVISQIITIPTRTHFMMADPVSPEIADEDIIMWRK